MLADKECNPSLISIMANVTHTGQKDSGYGMPLPAQSIVSLVIWFLCLLYASIRSSSNTSLGKIAGGGSRSEDNHIPLSESRENIVSGQWQFVSLNPRWSLLRSA